MRESSPSPALQAAPRLTRSLLAREVGRAAAAFGIYLLLRPVWEWTGLKAVCRAIVLSVAEQILIATQHFPVVASLSGMTIHNIDFVMLLAVSLFLVSTSVGWLRRLKLFGSALAVIVGLQIAGSVLTVMMTAAQELQNTQHILVLLPSEFRIVDRVKYALYDLGQPAILFALFVLTLVWNSGSDVFRLAEPATESRTGERRTVRYPRHSRRMLGLGLVAGIALASISGWWVWNRWRESDPRHVEAHAKIGHLFWAKGDNATAEEQYRIAVAGGTADPEVFYNLAGIAARHGRFGDARQLLDRCSELTTDPDWRSRVERAVNLLQSARPGQVLAPGSDSGVGGAPTAANPVPPN